MGRVATLGWALRMPSPPCGCSTSRRVRSTSWPTPAPCWPATSPTCRPRSASAASGRVRARPGSPATPTDAEHRVAAAALAGQLVVADLVAGTAAIVPVPERGDRPSPRPHRHAGRMGGRAPALGARARRSVARRGCSPRTTIRRCGGGSRSSWAARRWTVSGALVGTGWSGPPCPRVRRRPGPALVHRRPGPPRPRAHPSGLSRGRHPERGRHRLDPARPPDADRGRSGSRTSCPTSPRRRGTTTDRCSRLHPRDQRRIEVRGADPRSGATEALWTDRDDVWVERRPGHARPPGRRAGRRVLGRRRPAAGS